MEVTGVTEKLTNALMKLYQEEKKPDDPIAYIRKCLCVECPDENTVNEMKEKLDELVKEKKEVEIELSVATSSVKKTVSEANLFLTQQYEALNDDENGNSLLKEYLNNEIFEKLKDLKTDFNGTLLDNIQCGLTHFDSEIGIFASDPHAYVIFEPLFNPVLEDYHEIDNEVKQPDIDFGDCHDLEDLDPENKIIKSVRVMIGRSLDNYEFMPLLNVEKLEEIEDKIKKELVKIEDEEFKGTYHSLSEISDEQQKEWIEDGTLFSNPDDKFLKAAGTYRFWPKGRGLFINEKKNFRAWVNEEEHLQIVSSEEGANLQSAYERLTKGFDLIKELNFAKHPRFGFVAHNLKHIGNTLRIIVKAKLPKLSLEENSNKFETLLETHGIKMKKTENGIYELTNGKRIGMTEIEAARNFQKGIKDIITAEKCLYL